MKIRRDFVTNSSSGSFLMALENGKLSQKQKDIIVDFVEKEMLGKIIEFPKLNSKEEAEAYCDEKEIYLATDSLEKLIEATNNEKQIRMKWIYSDDIGYHYVNMFEELLTSLDGVDGFKLIDYGYEGF